jgi:organic hydroperoxide reductase OsmC/OhrA
VKGHRYRIVVEWSAGDGPGTTDYGSYSRDHAVTAENKRAIEASADSTYRGNAARYNPEELMLASVSACHMLWYLHLCATSKIVVREYRDEAFGTLELERDGSGRFTEVTLHPTIVVEPGTNVEKAIALHERAHELCFIARSVNFPIKLAPVVTETPASS